MEQDNKFFTGNPDADRMILLNLESEYQILNICKSNKYAQRLCNENFFRELMYKRYPKLVYLKKNYITWKELYLKIAHYNAKMLERFGIPYFNLTGYNPIEIYNLNRNYTIISHSVWKEILAIAVEANDISIIQEMLKYGISNFSDDLLELAINHNKSLVVEYALSNFNYGRQVLEDFIEYIDVYHPGERADIRNLIQEKLYSLPEY
jgi:hypothetical protein